MFGRRSHAPVSYPAAPGHTSPDQPRDPYAKRREEMLEHQLRDRGVVMHSVLQAMAAIPRHLFVSHEYSDLAYADEALPSVENQTISQPYIVGIMTQELAIRPGQDILEIGTGTGYQTAILAWLTSGGHLETPAPADQRIGHVFSIERVPALAQFARHRLDALGIRNVQFFVGDGSAGWPRHLPDDLPDFAASPAFDRIIVTAATPKVPSPLLDQLKDGGIMVVPIGEPDSQTLTRIDRRGITYTHTPLLSCRFVPLLGAYAWDPVHPPVPAP